MKTSYNPIFWPGVLAWLFLTIPSLRADPISLPEKSIIPGVTMLIGASILLEAICIMLWLRRFQIPRFFILWILGLHLVTYPGFIGLLWRLQNLRPALAAGIGEGLVVLIEGLLIYGICRIVPPARPVLPPASLTRCLAASLIGNAFSAAAFPILFVIGSHFHSFRPATDPF